MPVINESSRLCRQEGASVALATGARVGRLVSGRGILEDHDAVDSLLKTLGDWVDGYGLPSFDQYGVTESDLNQLVQCSRRSSMKTNPVILSDAELRQIMVRRLKNSDAVERGRP